MENKILHHKLRRAIEYREFHIIRNCETLSKNDHVNLRFQKMLRKGCKIFYRKARVVKARKGKIIFAVEKIYYSHCENGYTEVQVVENKKENAWDIWESITQCIPVVKPC